MSAITQRPRIRKTAALAVAGIALLFFLPALGTGVIQREQELRVALTARSMAEGGSWLTPEYLGQLRIRKPPLMYWAVAVAYKVGGATDSARLARLPSALAGVGLALLVYYIARGFWGQKRGLLAGILCATSVIILRQARLAETDVMLTLWVTLAVWSGYRALFTASDSRWMIASGLAAGLGFMTKGPAALALPMLAWLSGAIFCARARPMQRRAATRLLLWLALALLVSAPWYLYLLARAGSLVQLRQELSATFGDTTRHAGPWYYYFYSFFQAFAPWCLLLPTALIAAWRKARGATALCFTLGWFISSFATLSLTSSKQIHYTTLLVPAASMLVAWHLGFFFTRPSRRVRWSVAALALFWVLVISTAYFVTPQREPKQAILDALSQCQAEVHAATRVALVGPHRATVEFHAGRPIMDMDSLREAWRRTRAGDLIVVNNADRDMPDLPGASTMLGEADVRGLRCVIWQRTE